MGTFYHFLRANKAKKMPTHFLLYDTETREVCIDAKTTKHVLKLGVACRLTRVHGENEYREEWLTFHSIIEFWSFVMKYVREMSCVYLVAHNQHFDFPVVNGFNYLTQNGWKMSKPILDSNLFMVNFKKEHKTIRVLDSLNWFKFSIKTLGDNLGVPKIPIDFASGTLAELETYCHRDVEILKQTIINWIKFLEENDLGNFKPTIASQAFAAYKHRFMHDKICIHAHPLVTKLERASYRGGRTECYFIGGLKQPIFDLDVNSLYPYVMKNENYPVRLVKYFDRGAPLELARWLTKYLVIARVKVHITQPFLAVRRRRLIFPVGTFECTLTTPELQYTLKHGEILEVYEYAVYEGKPIFRDYVDTLYKLRQKFKAQDNKVYDLNTKLCLNGLYGKFGQMNEDIKEIGECNPDVCDYEHVIIHETHEEYLKWRFGGKVFIRHGLKKEWKHSFVAVASHVAAYARMALWYFMLKAKRENVYYVDTDSLFVNVDGYNNLKEYVSSKQLGMLKLESHSESLVIYGLKDYIFGDIVKRKGIRKDAEQLSENMFTQERFLKFRSLLRNRSLDAPLVEKITKTLSRKYKKGLVQQNGNVLPYQLPRDEYLFESSYIPKGRQLPTVTEIYEKALELFHLDNRKLPSITPTRSELQESGYLKQAQIELMTDMNKAYEAAFLASA